MKETHGLIERIRRINAEYQHLELAVDEALYQLKPGQSLLARADESWNPYLRQHWWPVGMTAQNKLLVEQPAGIRYEPGQVIHLLGPVGEPYRFRKSLRNVLLMAYDTPPTPLLMMIHWLLRSKISVTLALLGSSRTYDTQHLSAELEIIHADDQHTWPDQVMTLGWADQVFVVAGQQDEEIFTQTTAPLQQEMPRPDEEHRRFAQILQLIHERRNDVPKQYVFGIFQSVIACGIGACDACMLRSGDELKLICVDGPAFDLTSVKLT